MDLWMQAWADGKKELWKAGKPAIALKSGISPLPIGCPATPLSRP